MIREAVKSVWRILTLKRGGLFWVASFTSLLMVPALNAYSQNWVTPQLEEIDNIIFEDTETKNLLMPIITQTIGMLFYFLFNLIDLFLGLLASKIENKKLPEPKKDWLQSNKLYKTVWKNLGVFFLTSLITVIAVLMETFKTDSFYYWASIWALVIFWLMAIGFEFHSFGENIERAYGKKPGIFGFWDKILDAFEKKAIKKVEDL